MTRLLAITSNTFLQTVRQPIYAVIVLVTLLAYVMAPPLTGWTMDDDNKLLRDIGLSTLLMQGLFLAAFAASAVISQEIEQKTVLVSVSKPLSRGVFVLGKAFGVFTAVTLAFYLGLIAFLMSMRHGVLQTASETSDPTVITFGPGVVLLMLIAAGALNYLFDWKFLPTAIALIAPALTVSIIVLSFVDRDWKFSRYQTRQQISALPEGVPTPDVLRGIVEFEPEEGYKALPGAPGTLVRSNFKGPITDDEREYLRSLAPDDYRWCQQLDFLVTSTRKITTPDLLRAAVLILPAILVLCSVAIAASTRLSTVPTLLTCVVVLCAGLVADHYLQPLDEQGVAWAQVLYRVLPNFQFFWMIDALTDDRVIPTGYVLTAVGYAVVWIAGMLALAAALFETREVG